MLQQYLAQSDHEVLLQVYLAQSDHEGDLHHDRQQDRGEEAASRTEGRAVVEGHVHTQQGKAQCHRNNENDLSTHYNCLSTCDSYHAHYKEMLKPNLHTTTRDEVCYVDLMHQIK